MSNKTTCWICKSDDLKLIKKSDVENISSQNFQITNADYGITGELVECQNCGFVQCTDLNDVLAFYEDMEDEGYEATREERKLQESKIVDQVLKYKKSGSLLDIGAGSGALVEVALEKGFEAEGVEPSQWLQKKATERNLPIHLGIFPDAVEGKKYDVITLIDVIEHVPNPLELSTAIAHALNDDGIAIIVTPDKDSVAAKLLGKKWWHFRIAHIGYFNKSTLNLMTKTAGLETLKVSRPKWYFRLEYLFERLTNYLPRFLHFKLPKFLRSVVIPLNLRDSLQGVYTKSKLK